MKGVLLFIGGMIVGAVLLYGFLWYQVYQKLDATWCQVYSGKVTIERAEHCAKLVKQSKD